MVSRLLLFCAGLLTVSSGCAPLGGRTADDFDRAFDGAAPETGIREMTMEEFDYLERCKEHAIDPSDASLETLLSIPGFPEELAKRLVEARQEGCTSGTLIGRLTLAEREELGEFREYVAAPRNGSLRFDCRATDEDVGGAAERREGRISISARGFDAIWRGRRSEDQKGDAFYASAGDLSHGVRLHAGSLVPDLGMGLLFGGLSSPYFFSKSYPFHGSRPIAGNTSFSSPAVFGGAAELKGGPLEGLILMGRPRLFRRGRFELEKERVFGGRCAVLLGAGETGFSVFRGSSGSGGTTMEVDAAWSVAAVRTGFELDVPAGRTPGCLWGLSYREGGTHVGFLLVSVPRGAAGRFSSAGGGVLGAGRDEAGASAVLEREILSKFRLRAALERSGRREGLDEVRIVSARIACDKRWRRASLRISWSRDAREQQRVVPYPPESPPALENTTSLGAYAPIRIARGATLKLTVERRSARRALGFLFSPALSARFLSNRFEASVSGAMYRVFEGRPVCYSWEPSLSGVYPWRAVSSNERSGTFLFGCNFNGLTVSCKARVEVRRRPELSLQAAFRL